MSTNGSAGGGAIRLIVGGVFEVDGHLSARGGNAAQEEGGGGSGGSIWITAGSFAGTGLVSVDGGAGEPYEGGGGGAGRIAVYSPSNIFEGVLSAQGGPGYLSGQPGSVYSATLLPIIEVLSQSPTGLVGNPVSSVTLVFDTILNGASLSSLSLGLNTPGGPVNPSAISVTQTSSSELMITFPPQTVMGEYTLTLGPQLTDIYGQALTQGYVATFAIGTPVIEGRVTLTNGSPVAGVAVQSSQAPYIYTDSNGYYVAPVPFGTILNLQPTFLPFNPGTAFTPPSRGYVNVTQSISNQNFTLTFITPPVFAAAPHPQGVAVHWQGFAGVSYQLQYSTNLLDWAPYGLPALGTNGLIQLTIPVTGDAPRRFFRLTTGN
jgi:hypothetical protein